MVLDLFVRTLSQALQAFTPIAISLMWFERIGDTAAASAIRRGLIVSLPATFVASWLFRHSVHQALDEALLASLAVAATAVFARSLWRTDPAAAALPGRVVPGFTDPPGHRTGGEPRMVPWAITAVAALIVVRQTMEVGALLIVASELRVLAPMLAIFSALATAGCAAWAMRRLGARLPDQAIGSATRAFVAIFFLQSAMYAFHELAEARLLPFSEALHAATEPYGPDGIYGVHFSDLLLIVPLLAAAVSFLRAGNVVRGPFRFAPRRRLMAPRVAILVLALIGLQSAGPSTRRDDSSAGRGDVAAIRQRPHLLFRDMTRTAPTGTIPSAGMLSVAPLEAPESRRAATDIRCERLSFAAGRGLCLYTTPGIFSRYTAAVLDGNLKPVAAIALEGRPSRTRTSADGRLGATTVFVFGENYAAPFSTRTTIVDMSSGDVIGELEQFNTWRDGARFRAVDFNFWGVTFAADANTFYATLRTGNSTYLVRGDLALRRMTVLRDNVECPSLSPDNRTIAFKKRVGPGTDEWRLAVLDLKTMNERLIDAEKRRIDDQVEWLDSTHVLYTVPGGAASSTDVWIAAIDGSAPARVFLPEADSPIVVR